MRRLWSVALVVPLLGAATRGPVPGEPLTAFIRSAALPGGPIATHPDRTFVSPYVGNLAALGLADDCHPSGRRVLRSHLFWYAGLSRSGPVVDHEVTPGGTGLRRLSRGDSVDAYDGTFLLAAAAAWRTAGAHERRRLRALRPGVRASVERLVALRTAPWGLTQTAFDWPAAYLMDAVEVHQGLRAIERTPLVPASLQPAVTDLRHSVRQGVRTLPRRYGLLPAAVTPAGLPVPPDEHLLYPDVAAQLWVVTAPGLLPDAAARRIMTRLAPQLGRLSRPRLLPAGQERAEAVGYWPLLVPAWQRVGRPDIAAAVRRRLLRVGGETDWRWPFTTATAGLLRTGGWPTSGARFRSHATERCGKRP